MLKLRRLQPLLHQCNTAARRRQGWFKIRSNKTKQLQALRSEVSLSHISVHMIEIEFRDMCTTHIIEEKARVLTQERVTIKH